MYASKHHFHFAPAAVLAAAALLLAGCGVDEESLAGVWEGESPGTSYLFHLERAGRGRVRVTTTVRTVEYECNWSVSGDRLKLQHGRGGDVVFKIINQDRDRLVLSVGGSIGAVCRLVRVGAR